MVKKANKRTEISAFVRDRGEVTGSEICRHFDMSRQALHRHMKQLVAEGEVIQRGVTRGATYHSLQDHGHLGERGYKRTYSVEGLQEDRVWDQIETVLGLTTSLAENVRAILEYAFTEMLNNVIDHSKSERCDVEFTLHHDKAVFTVRDYGLGVFETIKNQLKLQDESDALAEVIKGKTTTMPERHTGKGIFFTSRVADFFRISSHRLALVRDRDRDDVFAEQQRAAKGTRVEFRIGRRTTRRLEHVFNEFAPERHDFTFGRTSVSVKLFQDQFISRSEARRLLAGLDRFKEIELDFKDVKSMGQGFADEVFRVFKEHHPEIEIRSVNANEGVAAMLSHVAPD
ncbi:MAG: DUF4325 domain-containing protein [Verrucomicrobia bacterium]|nr:DUF4325 domain-containing protein [Verrucomicrobiota bacterium]